MINVDAVYVIALPKRIPSIVAEMAKHDIRYVLINAVEDENGIRGLQLSMENVLCEALGKGYGKIMVVEDDTVFECENVKEKINKCIEELPGVFDCLQLGANLVLPPEPFSENLMKIRYSHSTHCVIYSRAGMWRTLSILDKKTHLDTLIYKHIQSKGRCFCSRELIANQRDGYSFIEKRETKYGSMMKRKYQQWNSQLSTSSI